MRLETERQKAAKGGNELVAICRLLSLAICRKLSPFAVSSGAHGGSDEGNEPIFRQTSSLSTA
jgi:hypothetical protein